MLWIKKKFQGKQSFEPLSPIAGDELLFANLTFNWTISTLKF